MFFFILASLAAIAVVVYAVKDNDTGTWSSKKIVKEKLCPYLENIENYGKPWLKVH